MNFFKLSNFCENLHEVNHEFLMHQEARSPEQVCRKQGLTGHAFHVINVTFFGSLGSSAANTSSSGSSKMSSPRFALFREDSNLGSCINTHRKPSTRTVPKEHVLCQSLCYNISQPCRGMTPKYHRAALNETLFERKRFQAGFLVFQAKTRGRRTSQGVEDTTTVHHQSSRNLSCFRLPVLQVQLSKQNFFQA